VGAVNNGYFGLIKKSLRECEEIFPMVCAPKLPERPPYDNIHVIGNESVLIAEKWHNGNFLIFIVRMDDTNDWHCRFCEYLNKILSDKSDASIFYPYEDDVIRKLVFQSTHSPRIFSAIEMAMSREIYIKMDVPAFPTGMSIEPFISEKADLYSRFLKDAFSNPIHSSGVNYDYVVNNIRKSATNNEFFFDSLWSDEELVGLVCGCGDVINLLAIKNEYRKMGLGYYLIYGAMGNILDNHLEARLHVLKHKPSVLRFYKNIGMQIKTEYSCTIYKKGANT